MIDLHKQSRRVAFVAVLATAAMLFGPYSVAQNERTKVTMIGGAVGGVVGGDAAWSRALSPATLLARL